jgi:putative ABC transport system permease protein
MRTALRLAWREAKRAKGRSALVMAMIAVPVMAITAVLVNYDTFDLSPAERADRMMGATQAAVAWPYDGPVRQEPDYLRGYSDASANRAPTEQQLLAHLPAGTTVLRSETGTASVHTLAGIGSVDTRALDYTDPRAQGILRQVSGHAPTSPDEVALTAKASERLGDTVTLADGSRTFKVVGIVEDPTNLNASTIVLRPGALEPGSVTWLAATPNPLTWAEVKQLNTFGITAVSRHVLANPPAPGDLYDIGFNRNSARSSAIVLVGGLAMLEVVLLAGAAFAVGARRRQRSLALVAAVGGTPGHVRRIVVADGVVHGVIAGVVGAVLGIVAAVATIPWAENALAHTRAGALRVSVPQVLVLAGVGALAGVVASLAPAWMSSRQNVLAALAGRRGITRSRRRWVVVGLVLLVVGVVVWGFGAFQAEPSIVLIGLVVDELALVLCTPALVGLIARVSGRLPPAARIALRNASRNRTAAAPAISAVMAAVIGSLVVGVVIGSTTQQEQATSSMRIGNVSVYSPEMDKGVSFDQARTALRATMPVDRTYDVSTATCGGQECLIYPVLPEGQACPYLGTTLGHPPTSADQRAALADARCANVRYESTYFGFAGVGGGGLVMTVVIDPSAAAAVSDLPEEDVPAVTEALQQGKVVVDNGTPLDNGTVTLGARLISRQEAPPHTVTTAAFALPHRPRAGINMMTPETATRLGFSAKPFVTLATTTRTPTVAEGDALQGVLGNNFGAYVERGPSNDDSTLIVLAIVAGIITLGAAALATGLTAADGRAELSTLAAIGASPRLRRLLSLSQSGVIAGLGSVLGGVFGLGAAVAVLTALNRGYASTWPTPTPYPIAVPWLNVLITLLVVPLVAMLGAGLLTRSRLPIEHRL